MNKNSKVFILLVLLVLNISFIRTTSSFVIKESKINLKENEIPDEYQMNSELSKCSSGNISWDKEKDSITFKTNSPSKCNIYLEENSGNIYYSSLKLALDDLNSGLIVNNIDKKEASISVSQDLNKIKLLKDIVLPEEVSISKNIFINLNGKTLTFSNEKEQETFIKVENKVNLNIYGKKSGSALIYRSDVNNSIFSLGNNSTLKIEGANVSINYDGKSVYSILKDDRDSVSNIIFNDVNFIAKGTNISLLYSSKPLSIDMSDSILNIEAKDNVSLINLIDDNSSINIQKTSITYNEESDMSNSGSIINSGGKLALANSKIIIESASSINNAAKIVSNVINIDSVAISCKLNSTTSIIEVKKEGLIKGLDLTAANKKEYNGIKYIGNRKLKIISSIFDVKEKGTPVLYTNGIIELEDTNINPIYLYNSVKN